MNMQCSTVVPAVLCLIAVLLIPTDAVSIKKQESGVEVSQKEKDVKAKVEEKKPLIIKEEKKPLVIIKTDGEKPKAEEEKISYKNTKVIRITLKNKQEVAFIKALETDGEIETWLQKGKTVDVLIRDPETIKTIESKNLQYETVIDNLQRAIDEENPQLSDEEWSLLEGRKGYRLTWQMYHRMTDIHAFTDYLVATYPKNVTMIDIGKSVEGRPLRVIHLSSGQPDRPAIWVDAGIHAREWITSASLTYIISQMIEAGDGHRNVDWYFQPLVNPDGYEHSHSRDRLWRKNRANPEKGTCAGIDLNRNFGYKWGGQGASHQPCRETYAGSGPFSEPETAAIQNFITSKKGQVKGYVSLHSYGQYILYPWGYDRKVPADYQDLERVGRAMASAIRSAGGPSYTVGAAANTLYPASGGSDDWAKGTAKVKYSYTLELRDTGRHGFVLPAQYIIPAAKDAYAALDVLAKELSV